MKMLCIGRNYRDHAAELNNPVPEKPVFFLKPETALLRPGFHFYHPTFTQDIHHEIEVVVKICKNGKSISEKFAHKYYTEISLGLDFTARDIQADCKKKGLPWEIAKAFDHSAPVSPTFFPVAHFKDGIQNIPFELKINGETRQLGNTKDMIFTIDQIIAYLSQFVTLKKGDLIFTGTPAGVSKINIEDHLEGFLMGEKVLNVLVK
ncbi:MAG: acylpyruvate hydrolase [Luteibaculaceae bacterium]|jgi:acylpyruvate hydrolase